MLLPPHPLQLTCVFFASTFELLPAAPLFLTPSDGGAQKLIGLGHDLVLIGVQAKELDLESVGGVHHGHRDHARERPRGQLEATGAGQLDGQDTQEEGGQLLAQAGAHAAAEGQVVEAALLVLAALLAETVRVERRHLLEDSRGVVGVPDAVHHAPTFGDLDTLQLGQTEENGDNDEFSNSSFLGLFMALIDRTV